MLRLLKGGRFARDDGRTATNADVRTPGDELAPLVRAVCEGDVTATHTLATVLGPALLKVVRGVLGAQHPDVEDVTQEAAMAAIEALPRFAGRSSVLHFCCRIATFTALSACRRAAARAAGRTISIDELSDDEGPAATDSPDADAALIATRRRRTLRRVLGLLPASQSEALVQYVILGWSVDEIARAANVPPNTARSRLRLAKEALRRHLVVADEEDGA